MLVMLVASVMAAAASYLMRTLEDGRSARLPFLLFTLAAPLLLLVVVSLLHALARWRPRRRQRQQRQQREDDNEST